MPIFGKADAALPFVTQLMQVNIANDGEMFRFWRRAVALAQAEKESRFATRDNEAVVEAESLISENIEKWIFDVEAFSAIAEERGFSSSESYLLSEWHEACWHAQGIFMSLFEDMTVPMNALQWLRTTFPAQKVIDAKPDVFAATYATLSIGEREEGDIYVPLLDFVPTDQIGTLLPGYYLAAQVEQTIYDLWRKKIHLATCTSCRYVYLASRTGQLYCSHRCGNRVYQRERARQKKREGSNESPVVDLESHK